MKAHLKRLTAPNTWPIKTKETTFITRPAGTGSTMELTIPLVIVFKDMLGLATTTKEVKHILHTQEVFVDGKRAYDHDAGLGLMSVVSIPKNDLYYRLSINTKKKLVLLPIKKEEAQKRTLRVENKTLLGEKKIQLNALGGHNLLVDKDEFKVADTILVENNKVVQTIAFEKGALVFLYKGAHTGHLAKVEDIDNKNVLLKADDGQVFETRRHYCFVVGKEKPIFSVKA